MLNSNQIEIKFESKTYKLELPDLEGFTGQLTLALHCRQGIPIQVVVTKMGSVMVDEKLSTLPSKDVVI